MGRRVVHVYRLWVRRVSSQTEPRALVADVLDGAR